jgi:hypothetical protein
VYPILFEINGIPIYAYGSSTWHSWSAHWRNRPGAAMAEPRVLPITWRIRRRMMGRGSPLPSPLGDRPVVLTLLARPAHRAGPILGVWPSPSPAFASRPSGARLRQDTFAGHGPGDRRRADRLFPARG